MTQLFEFMKFGGVDRSRNSFNWRVKRLVKSGQLDLCQEVYGAGSAVYRIGRRGIALLEHHGQFTTVLHSEYRDIFPTFHRRSIRLN